MKTPFGSTRKKVFRSSQFLRTIAAAIMSCAAIAAPVKAAVQFNEVSVASGVTFQGSTAEGDMSWIDYNNDGLLDLIAQGRLHKNLGAAPPGQPQFAETGAFIGPIVGDYDGDGCDDAFSAISGQPNLLMRNMTCDEEYQPGDPPFQDYTAQANLDQEVKLSMAASFGDLNGDGFLDIYVANWTCHDLGIHGFFFNYNDVYINNQDGTFTRRSVEDAGDLGCAWATALSDYDNDGDLDIIVVNDTFICDLGLPCNNRGSDIIRNRLKEDGTMSFEFIGLGVNQAAMGVGTGDYNNDGIFDYYQSDIGWGTLTTGNGTGSFSLADSEKLVNPADPSNNFTGWGSAFFDANNDGFLDLAQAVTGVNGAGIDGPNILFLNNADPDVNGDVTFTEIAGPAGFGGNNAFDRGRSLAVADYDNDGDIDAVTGNKSATQGVSLYQNNSTGNGPWVKINLVGNNPNHRGIGAKVFLNTSIGGNPSTQREQVREINSGTSYGSSNDPRAHFGLGDHDTIDNAAVVWASGCTQTVTIGGLNQTIDALEANCTNIHGRVTLANGTPVQNLFLQSGLQQGGGASAVTACGGYYRMEVTPNTYYTNPVDSTYTYAPFGYLNSVSAGDNISANFTATPLHPSVTGKVTVSSGDPVQGITMQAGIQDGTAWYGSTDCRGNYRIKVPPNVYYVNPLTTEYTYSPFGYLIPLFSGQFTGNFTVTPTP